MRKESGQHDTNRRAGGGSPGLPGGPAPDVVSAALDCSGGLTTNSPPSNIQTLSPRIFASGVDSLELTSDVTWTNPAFFDELEELKTEAAERGKYPTIDLKNENPDDACMLYVHGYGSGGYNLLLTGPEYTIKLGGPQPDEYRPNVFASIRSELLHGSGVGKAVDRLTRLIEFYGGTIHGWKVSRADVFTDILVDEKLWTREMQDLLVTRARYISSHTSGTRFTGFSIGKGKISARIYDKLQEIIDKSKKFWMYKVWNLHAVPEGSRIIRVEFQLRREKLKDLDIDSVSDLKIKAANLWGYCTQDWLTMKDEPEKQHHRRKIVPWWLCVQNGFCGFQQPTPQIPTRAVNQNRDRLATMMMGFCTSLMSVDYFSHKPPDRDRIVFLLGEMVPAVDWNDYVPLDVEDAIRGKVARYHRKGEKHTQALRDRAANGLTFLDQYKQSKQGGEL